MMKLWMVVGGVAALLTACGGAESADKNRIEPSVDNAWDGGQFRTAAEQRIRRDNDTDEVICETPTPAEIGTVFACRAPYTNSRGNVAWNDYKVEIVGDSDFKVTAAGSFTGD